MHKDFRYLFTTILLFMKGFRQRDMKYIIYLLQNVGVYFQLILSRHATTQIVYLISSTMSEVGTQIAFVASIYNSYIIISTLVYQNYYKDNKLDTKGILYYYCNIILIIGRKKIHSNVLYNIKQCQMLFFISFFWV